MNLTKGYLGINKDSPERLIYFVTNRCNSKCTHCFYWKELNNKAKEELNLEEIKKIAKSLGNFYELFLSGGEPFLREDLEVICKIFYDTCKIKHIHIPTNCLLGDKITKKIEEIIKECPGLKLTIGISLEGLEKTNDKIRGVKGHFKNAINLAIKLNKLREKNKSLNIYFISTISKQNIKEIFPLAVYVKKKTGSGLEIAPIRGDPKSSHLLCPDYKEYISLLNRLYSLNKEKGKGILQRFSIKKTKYIHKIIAEVLRDNKLPFQCLAGEKIGVLEPNGEVKLCELTGSIGNLRDYDYNFKRLWRDKKANILRQKIKGCYCTHGCFISTSLKHSLKEIIKLIFLKSLD